jgi:hypothetical protein
MAIQACLHAIYKSYGVQFRAEPTILEEILPRQVEKWGKVQIRSGDTITGSQYSTHERDASFLQVHTCLCYAISLPTEIIVSCCGSR